MKTKYLLIIATVLIVSIFACITINATLSKATDIEEPKQETSENNDESAPRDYTSYGTIFFDNSFADKEITIKHHDGTTDNLVYKYSTTFNGTDILKNIYADSSDNEYFIDAKGNLIGFFRNPSYYSILPMTTGEPIPEDKWINEDQAIKTAQEHIFNFYGDICEKLILTDKKITDDAVYEYEFIIPAGKDGSITAVKCLVDVLFDGRIVSSAVHGFSAYLEANEDILNSVSYEVLLEYVTELAKSAYADTFEGIEIIGVELQLIENSHVIRITSTVDFKTELGTVGGASETFYYPIS